MNATTSTLPPPPLGRRAKLTQTALETASAKVIKILTDERMAQCFPTYKDEYPELITMLRKAVVDKFEEGVPKAWELHTKAWDFIAKANELDRIVEDADDRRKRGETPLDLYLKGADPTITFPAKTVPVLQAATAELRTKRLALEAKNATTYASIAQLQAVHTRTEAQIKNILDEFQKTMEILQSIDTKQETELQEKILKALPELP